MTYLTLIVGLFTHAYADNSCSNQLNALRKSFHLSIVDESHISDFLAMTRELNEDNSTLKAYRAAGYVMKAKIDWNPIERIHMLMKYQKTINLAIENDPLNVEVRFMRFAIAYYLPDILGLKIHMEDDRQAMLENLYRFDVENLDPTFNHFIIWFLENCGYYSENEIDRIKRYMKSYSSLK